MRNKVTKHPSPHSWKLPILAMQGMETGTGDGIVETSQESVHHSDEDVSQDFDPKVSNNMDSSGPTKLHKNRKKKDIFEDSDTDVDEVVYQGTKVKLSPKKDSSVLLPLKVGKKKVSHGVGEDNNRISSDNIKASKIVGSDKSKACKDMGSDNGQESDNEQDSDIGQDKINDKNNVAAVGDDYQNEVNEYFAKLQAQYPNDKIPFMTNGQKLSVCLGYKKVPMLDKFNEQLEIFHKDNVLHAND